jgi:hypothetical protein
MSEKGASGLVARRFPFVCLLRDGKIAAEVKQHAQTKRARRVMGDGGNDGS